MYGIRRTEENRPVVYIYENLEDIAGDEQHMVKSYSHQPLYFMEKIFNIEFEEGEVYELKAHKITQRG